MSQTPQRFTPPNIQSLQPGEIFVFGSNTEGRHGKGAAKQALRMFGARWNKAEGLCGSSYALPTVGHRLSKMPAEQIRVHVERFKEHARCNQQLTYLVTLVGCGLAGHTEAVIGPMFKGSPPNVVLPLEFHQEIEKAQ